MSFSCEFFEIREAQLRYWEEIFPGVPVVTELKKMEGWLRANPERRKKRYMRFAFNWLAKVHGRLLEAEVAATVRATIGRQQERADASVGLWEGYKR